MAQQSISTSYTLGRYYIILKLRTNKRGTFKTTVSVWRITEREPFEISNDNDILELPLEQADEYKFLINTECIDPEDLTLCSGK